MCEKEKQNPDKDAMWLDKSETPRRSSNVNQAANLKDNDPLAVVKELEGDPVTPGIVLFDTKIRRYSLIVKYGVDRLIRFDLEDPVIIVYDLGGDILEFVREGLVHQKTSFGKYNLTPFEIGSIFANSLNLLVAAAENMRKHDKSKHKMEIPTSWSAYLYPLLTRGRKASAE